jgi:hypothetical protein
MAALRFGGESMGVNDLYHTRGLNKQSLATGRGIVIAVYSLA